MIMKQTRLPATLILAILFLFVYFLSVRLEAQNPKQGTISQQNFERASRVYKKAETLFNKGKLDEAQKKIQDCLTILPQYADAHFLSAQISMKRNEFTQAMDRMDTAKTVYPIVMDYMALSQNDRLSQKREQLSHLKAQESSLEQALTNFCTGNPNRAPIEQSLASVKGSIARLEGNPDHIQAYENELPADYHYITGNILYKLGRPEEALAEYKTAIRLDPTHSRAYNNMALAHFALKQHQEALSCLIRAELSGAKVNDEFKRALEEKVSEANRYD